MSNRGEEKNRRRAQRVEAERAAARRASRRRRPDGRSQQATTDRPPTGPHPALLAGARNGRYAGFRDRAIGSRVARRARFLGVPGASLDDIARRAGVGAGTVHRHFPTKDELLVAVLAERLQDLADAVGALVDAEDRAQRSSPSFAGSRRTRDRTPRSPPPSPTPAEVGDTVREASRALQDGFGALLERAQAAEPYGPTSTSLTCARSSPARWRSNGNSPRVPAVAA
jgi:AcrR family transcriptional regulator